VKYFRAGFETPFAVDSRPEESSLAAKANGSGKYLLAVIATGHDMIEQARTVYTRMARHEPSLPQ